MAAGFVGVTLATRTRSVVLSTATAIFVSIVVKVNVTRERELSFAVDVSHVTQSVSSPSSVHYITCTLRRITVIN